MPFFAKSVECKPCGMFNIKHLILSALTILGVAVAVKHTKIEKREDIKKIIIKLTSIIWILEILKIIFNFWEGNGGNLNTYVPLYYCSILLYAGLFSAFGKGKLQRIGDVFITTGGIVAGIIFLIFPSSSLQIYKAFHFVTIQSFFYHGVMIYLGILLNKYNYIELNKKDIIYYATLVGIIAILALILNNIYGCNLMFISEDFPGTPLTYLYILLGKSFTAFMILAHIILPFYIMYFIQARIKVKSKQNKVYIMK